MFDLPLLPSERLSAAPSPTDGFCASSKEHTLLSKYCLEVSALNLHKYAHMHTNVCPNIDAYMRICHQKELSIICTRTHTHRANLKTFLQASCEYKKRGKKQAALLQSPMDHLLAEMSICHVYIGFDDSGNSLFSSGWNWLQRRTNLFCTSLQLSTNRKNPSATQHGLDPTCCSSTRCVRGGKKPSWGSASKVEQQLTLGLFSAQSCRRSCKPKSFPAF